MSARTPRSSHGKPRYSATQIRAVLRSTVSVAQAAQAAGVAVSAASSWRSGALPQWFVDEEQATRAAVRASRAVRFCNPADARAGR